MAYDPTTRAACVDEICRDLSEGITLSEICRRDHMPSRVAVYDWADADAETGLRIARARDVGFDAIAEQCLDIVDDKKEDPQSRRVRYDARLKLLAKWSPRKYGDRQQVAATTREGEDIPVSPVYVFPVDPTKDYDKE